MIDLMCCNRQELRGSSPTIDQSDFVFGNHAQENSE